MAVNRYISFLFMLITVLSAHPDGIYDLKGIGNLDLYNSIVKSGTELSQSKQYLKGTANTIGLVSFEQSRNEHQRLFAVADNSFSMNYRLFAVYNIKLEHKNGISLDKNDVWRHAVF